MPITKMRNSCAPLYSPEKKTDLVKSFMYNVIPEYKALTRDEIIEAVAANTLDYAVCMQNFSGEFNIATFIRNANAFGARNVFYFGQRKIDRRGCQGTHLYKDIVWLEDEDQLLSLKKDYHFVSVDNLPGAKPISEHVFKPKTMFIFGSEGEGILPSVSAMCEEMIYIPQRGSVPSINVASASAVVMHYAEINLSK